MNSNNVAPEMGASIGVRLKQAREEAGLSQEDVAASLKIPVKVIRQLESGDSSQLGAPVFVRGQLRSYARLLGVKFDEELGQGARPIAPSELVSHTHTPRYRRVFEQATRRAIYIVLTAAIAVPIWMASRELKKDDAKVESLDVASAPAAPANNAQPAAPAPVHRTPLVASMATLPTPAPAATQPALALNFIGNSWVEVRGADGRVIESGELGTGQQRTYAAGEVSRVVLGNSSAVEVRHAGRTVDLAPFSRANVARFTLSSDGSLTPGD
ncbi:helix-turn-helix domain-containing protein [Lysobacter changpingensis]|uniref:helix-turn-helix domain-containing protein n=1 Tax=Lysobacter changpingensis TaxID=2792784 RepID=UPI001A8DEBA2|nr:RodZ domain-containing protein [Lysobacter changpingensis]